MAKSTALATLILFGVILLTTACGTSKIQSFEAEPSRICADDTVEVRWQADGEARLTTEPDLPVSGTVAAADTVRLVLDRKTSFYLVPVDSDRTPDEQEVEVYSGEGQGYVVVPARVQGDSVIIGRDSTEHGAWSDFLRITRASNPLEWPITVHHAGREAVISPHSSSDALKGTPRAGTWQLHAPLTEGDPPDNLRIAVDLRCQRTGSN